MQIQPKPPSYKGTPDRFNGDVWVDVIASGEPPSRIRVNVVRFAPGARNAWHAHAVGDQFMTHLAMWEAPAEGPESEWGDHVTAGEYAG